MPREYAQREPSDEEQAVILAAGGVLDVQGGVPVKIIVTKGHGESVTLVNISFLIPNAAIEPVMKIMEDALDTVSPAIESVVPKSVELDS